MSANEDARNAIVVAAVLFFLAISASQLVAEEPVVKPDDQPAPLNNAEVKSGEPETLVFGLSIEENRHGKIEVVAVRSGTPAYEAGLRAGDELVAFGEVRDAPFETFLERARQVAEATYENDKIQLVFKRDGRRERAWLKGSGRSPESVREIQEKSEEAIEEKLEPELLPQGDNAESTALSTEQLEEYAQLNARLASGALRESDYERYDRLAGALYGGVGTAAVVAPGGFGATSGGGGAVGPTGPGSTPTPQTGQGQATPGTAIGDPSATPPNDAGAAAQATMAAQLGGELLQLRQAQARGGALDEAQSRRLQVLDRLSRGSIATPNGSASPFNPQLLTALQSAQQQGDLSPSQQLQLRQLQQQQFQGELARSLRGTNQNPPIGGAANPGAAAAGAATPGAASGAGGAVPTVGPEVGTAGSGIGTGSTN